MSDIKALLKALEKDQEKYSEAADEAMQKAIGESRHSRWWSLAEHSVYDGISAYITRLIEDIEKGNLEEGNR